MMRFNYHTHSNFCDGKNELEEYVLKAIEKKFSYLGFSGHGPVPFPNHYAIEEAAIVSYCERVRQLAEQYKDQIKIFLALEMDYIPGETANFQSTKDQYQLDYVIGSVHLVKNKERKDLWFIDGGNVAVFDEQLQTVFGGDYKQGVRCFYEQTMEMIEKERPDLIGHVDKIKMNNKGRYFTEKEDWLRELEEELICTISKSGTICEVNTRGLYKLRHTDFYPSVSLMKRMHERGIRFTISTDAHKIEEMDSFFIEAAQALMSIGVKEVFYFDGNWREVDVRKLL